MEDAQNLSSKDQDDLAQDALESVGVGEPTERIVDESQGATHMQGDGNSGKEVDLPLGVKERLGRQEKRHQREMRQMRAEMQSLMSQNQPNESQQMNGNYGDAPVDDQIQQAVRLALQAQDEQKRKAKEKESADHVNKRYQSLQDNLDKGSDKYEDFDEVVRAQDAPYTSAMRDAALFLDNPAEVLYKLGKKPEELKRIAQLHPVDQAREMVKLSHALMGGGDASHSHNSSSKPIGQIKSNPVNQSSVNDKTPVGEIRRRMKAGDWKSNR